MPLNAGGLNRRITIKRAVSGRDAAGQPLVTEETVCTAWADIKVPPGMAAAERIAADRQVSTMVCSIRIRFRRDITAQMRVVCDLGLTYDIRQVIPDLAGREYTDLVCETVPS